MRSNHSPSIYSIYHNALPFYLDRADICTVDDETADFAGLFSAELLTGTLARQINVSTLAADKLRHLYFESRNFEKIFGTKTFGFGYPLLIDSFNSDLVVSPLFIWQLALEPAQARVDSWIVKSSEQGNILPNYRLLDHLKEKYGLDLVAKMEEMAFNRQVGRKELEEISHEIAARLNFDELGSIDDLIPSPGIDEIGEFTQTGALHWSGVLGMFPPQNHHWKAGDARPEDVLVPTAAEGVDEFVFAYQPDDPEQATALETIARQKMTVVEGEDALGKTQTLVNLLINALSNGQKCLVVSERAQALKYAQHLLAKAGFNQFHFLLDDALNDKMPLLELLRVAAANSGRHTAGSEEGFQVKKNKFLREKVSLQATYSAVKTNIFGGYDWTETVGLFLASNRIEGKELLNSQLSAQDFSYTALEHAQMREGILRSEPLFERVKTLSHPLGNLNDRIFDNSGSTVALRFVQTQLKEFLEKTNQLHLQYIQKTDSYAARLKAHYREYFLQLESQARTLSDKISNYKAMLGSEFADAGSGAFEWPAFFSSKRKKIKQGQEDVAKSYKLLAKQYEKEQYFAFQFEPGKERANIAKTTENILKFRAALSQWHGQSDALVQDEVMRLNSKTAHPSLDVKEQITELEYSLDVLLDELNEAGLYQKHFENKTLTIPQRQKYLESIVEQLESTQLNLRDFEDFYQWQSNWLALGGLGQKVIRALVKVRPANWVAAFESWYFSNLLARAQSPHLPEDSAVVENATMAWHELKPLIFNQITNLWWSKQSAGIKALKKKNKKAYQLIFEKSGQKLAANLPLCSVWQEGFDAVSDFLPVLFVTPHVALNELTESRGYFDYVIFDEANKFSVEAATAIAPKGKKVVIMGSNDPHGNETSLLQYALENGVPSALISNRYEPPLSPFETWKTGKAPASQNVEYQVDNVEGRFHELGGTNDIEAQNIIRLLNQIKQTPQRIYPSVGIVTFTVEQRDLIANYLLKLKQQNVLGSEKIQQLERNGMGVFHIDELFGQQFDIIIVSCTFGLVNLKGALTKKLILLNTSVGVGHLKMLVNKPAQTFHIIHSLPEEQIKQFESKKWEEGTWLLAHFIRLAESTKSGNMAQLMISMEALGKRMAGEPPESVFALEVFHALKPYLDEKRISQNAGMDSLHFPLSIKALVPGGAAIVAHPDGFFADTPYTSALWEQNQRQSIANAGMEYLPVWSVDWLKNPLQEARSLASKIIRIDAQFQSNDMEAELKNEGKTKAG